MVQLSEFLVPHLQELAENERFSKGCTFSASSISDNNELLGLILRVSIEGYREGRADKLSVIVKMPPDSPKRRTQISAILTFTREAEFYAKFCPMLIEFQRERGVSEESEGFCAVPKCYKVITDADLQNYALILEDLQVGGYRTCNKLGTIDLAHVTLCVKNLAQFHALSFAIRDQRPDLLDEIRELKDIFYERLIDSNPHFEVAIHGALDRSIRALRPNEKFKIEKLLKLKAEAMQTFQKCASQERCEPFGVLVHGDCRNNNMLYRYGEDGTPDSIRLLDFQLLRYGSPATDLTCFLFTSTEAALRAQHYKAILQIYHQTLTDFVTRLGSDGLKAYSYKDFQEQLKKYGRNGILMAILVMHIIVMENKDLSETDQEAMEEAYNERIREVVSDVIRLGYY